jgi:hypothetical protein
MNTMRLPWGQRNEKGQRQTIVVGTCAAAGFVVPNLGCLLSCALIRLQSIVLAASHSALRPLCVYSAVIGRLVFV